MAYQLPHMLDNHGTQLCYRGRAHALVGSRNGPREFQTVDWPNSKIAFASKCKRAAWDNSRPRSFMYKIDHEGRGIRFTPKPRLYVQFCEDILQIQPCGIRVAAQDQRKS